ncbi:MAG: phenylalanine--tRNA ligase subunit alpha [Bdellovibrionales bacterium]|nr:phenylalanine--tRNA ligase subunit alpha [Bdellovibrionales bacterium]
MNIIDTLCEEALLAMNQATDSRALYEIKVKYWGKNGSIVELMKQMKDLSHEERPQFGQIVNQAKSKLETAFEERNQALLKEEMSKKLSSESIDMTLPGTARSIGNEHPIDFVTDEIVDIFAKLGYYVRLGPMIESDEHNFGALNIPPEHPARDMTDTFYIDENHSLRPHTSPIQIRTLRAEKLPIYVLGPGSVFRCDSDVSHSPMFHQIEGLVVDKKVSMADLKGTLAYFAREYFGQNVKTRFRPSFFPFTEPSAEVDCSCPLCAGKGCRMCKNTGWVEIGGCGCVHPNVLKASNINPDEWQGFAFGMGIERMAIIKYGITDIRLFFENDTRFLEQFKR